MTQRRTVARSRSVISLRPVRRSSDIKQTFARMIHVRNENGGTSQKINSRPNRTMAIPGTKCSVNITHIIRFAKRSFLEEPLPVIATMNEPKPIAQAIPIPTKKSKSPKARRLHPCEIFSRTSKDTYSLKTSAITVMVSMLGLENENFCSRDPISFSKDWPHCDYYFCSLNVNG